MRFQGNYCTLLPAQQGTKARKRERERKTVHMKKKLMVIVGPPSSERPPRLALNLRLGHTQIQGVFELLSLWRTIAKTLFFNYPRRNSRQFVFKILRSLLDITEKSPSWRYKGCTGAYVAYAAEPSFFFFLSST